jgi:hypothetical protein
VSCTIIHDADGRRIEVGDIVEWTAEAIHSARNGGDMLDAALVLEGQYRVVEINEQGAWLTTHPDPRQGVGGFPANPQSLRIIDS